MGEEPAGQPRRKRRSSEEIMDRLIAAAGAEFAANGYAGATTAAIARRGDVTEAQLFRYFPTKADLFREAVFKPLEQHIRAFNEAHLDQPSAETGVAQAHLYISELQGFLREHSRLLMSLLVAQAYAPASAGGDGMNSLDRYFERGAAMMSARVGDQAAVDPRLMVRVSFAAVLGCAMLDDWLFPPGMATQAEKDAAIESFLLHGIANTLG